MKNDALDPHTDPELKVPQAPDEAQPADEPEPDLTTPGGRFWELPLTPEEKQALTFRGY